MSVKIFSKFKDYYDHVQQFGQGDDVSYIRNTSIFLKRRPYEGDGWVKVTSMEYGYEVIEDHKMIHEIPYWTGYINVFFCGKIYRGKKIEQSTDSYGKVTPAQVIYDPEKYLKWFESSNPSRSDRYYLEGRLRLLSLNGEPDKHEINNKLSCPVLMSCSGTYGHYNVYNPRLYEVEFQKAIDPYTAYMELDMFISGVLGKTGGEMVTISDKDKIYKHGFDYKYGFRTRKE